MDTHRPTERIMPLIEIYRDVTIDPTNVARLVEIRDAAVAEFQAQVPELLQADLVRLGDDTWLDVLRWSGPVAPEQLEAAGNARRPAPRCTP
jgi:hypothetical protein